MPSFFDLQKFAHTGIASPDMTAYDKARALAAFGGGKTQTLTDVPPLSFKANGKPLISWSMLGNGQQTGTPTPDAPIQPEFVGVRTANLFDKSNSALVFEGYNLAIANTFSKGGTGIVLRVPCEALTTYTISGYVDTTLFRVAECNTDTIPDQNAVSVSDMIKTTTPQTYTLTTRADTKYILIQVGASATPDYINVLMLNSGSTALHYEPYGWKIPITCAGQTVPVYLGQVSTVRKIGKYELTGNETFYASSQTSVFYTTAISNLCNKSVTYSTGCIVNAYKIRKQSTAANLLDGEFTTDSNGYLWLRNYDYATVADFKAYIAAQYAAGTPVTVWYVLAEPTTAIVNEPLVKIGDYADELSSEDAGVSIPTAKGQNTLTVESELPPSSMTITYFEEV